MVPFGRTAAIFDVDDSLLDGNAGTIFTWYLYSERVMRADMRSRIPRIIYEYARHRLTEQDMVEVGSRCQQGLYADALRGHAHACFERHLRKRITSALLAGSRFFHLANMKGHVRYASLEAATDDSGVWEDRRLGVSETITLPNETEYSFSANNATWEPDIERRCRRIRAVSRRGA